MKILRLFVVFFALSVLFSGCASSPPVQEMSDARLAIQSAKDAEADLHAPQEMKQAESYLDQATENLNKGEYEKARDAALAAKEEAIRARDKASSTMQMP